MKPSKGTRPELHALLAARHGHDPPGKAGANSLTFRGRLSRKQVLAVGSYRLTLLATDATGKDRRPRGSASS